MEALHAAFEAGLASLAGWLRYRAGRLGASCGPRGCGGRVGVGVEDDGGLGEGDVLGALLRGGAGELLVGEEVVAVVVDGVLRSP